MGNKQQIQQQEQQKQYFQSVKDKMGLLVEQFNKVKQIENPSLFQIDLITNITQGIDTLNNYLNNSKIYIVFMGTTSSGKSTFINALLGQRLLPSRNQDCTKQISSIEHQNINDGNTQILINGKIFISLEEAYSKLKTIRDSSNFDKINIKTQSYFHTTLSKDLQNRVIFIDTPGIKLTDNCSDEKYLQHFANINQQIELDQYSKRINVWVSDCTTFDRDNEIQKNIIQSLKNKLEQNQIQNQSQDNKQIQQSNDESQLLYIINKFDQSNYEDEPIQQYRQEIKDVLNSDNIFKISALNALHYNTMNYGTQDAKNYFINQFYKDNKEKIVNFTESKAREHCNNNIKNNKKLIKNQDFNEFISKMSLQIKRVLDELFHYLFNDLNQKIQYLKFGEEFKEAKLKLTQLHKNKISQFWSNYYQKKLVNYDQELLKQKIIFDIQVQQLITAVKTLIDNNQDSNMFIEAISILTINMLDELNQNFLQKTIQSKNELLNDLTSIFQQEHPSSIIIERIIIIFKLMEECIYEQKKQFVQKQANELFSQLNIIVNTIFYQKVSELENTQINLLTIMIGGQKQREIVELTATLNALKTANRVANISIVITTILSVNIVISIKKSLFQICCLAALSGISDLCFNNNSHNYLVQKQMKNILKQKLDDWNQSLNKQSQDLVINYTKFYDYTLLEIRSLME